MRRPPFLAAILILGLAFSLPALAAARQRGPVYRPPVVVPPANFVPWNVPRWNNWGRLPANYRPRAGMRIVNANLEVTFTFNGDVGKVRTISPPEEFDDKGNIKKHTKEELKALKGDTPAEKKMVGYKSDISEVQVGDVIQVALSSNKANLQKAAKKGKKDKEADLEEEKPDKGGKSKWVTVAQVIGTVTKANAGNTDAGSTLTIRITTQVIQGRGGNRNQTIDPEQAQATLVIIGKRATDGQGGVPAGKRKKKGDE
jgi:hypothetical protein